MRLKSLAAAAAAFCLVSASFAQVPGAAPEFKPERFRAHVTFLADDLLEGREAGSRGFELGARYVASQFQALGLQPGAGGSWYQEVPFVRFRIGDAPARVTVGGRAFQHRREVVLAASPDEGAQRIEAPVVFVGYGIDAPEAGLNDYKGLDVRGKIVAVLSGYPSGLRSDVGAHLNSEKRRMADRHGAVGMLTIRNTGENQRRPWARFVEGSRHSAMTWLDKDGRPFLASPGLRFAATLDTPAAEALFAGSRRSLAQLLAEAARPGGKPKGFALRPRVAIEQQNVTERTTSPNVLGVLPGSDPALAGEYVLLMAHLDGLGIQDKPGEDDIHNGAMDNATGVATMLEVARAMVESGQRPRRPLLFAAVTAEEKGLLGAQYLAKNPVVSGRIASVVNLDMPILLYDFEDVIAFGAEHSTMGTIVARAGERMNIALSEDPLPHEGLFTRSDHYRFVQEGVPSVFLMTGFANGGREKFTGFLGGNYHSPKDDLQQPLDWNAGAKFARLNYLIAREIADSRQPPLWYADSFFGRSLGQQQPKAARPKQFQSPKSRLRWKPLRSKPAAW